MASSPRAAAAYFALQGIAVAGWWALLLLAPSMRPWFFPAGDLRSHLLLFAPADLLVLAPASLAAAWVIVRGGEHARAAGWLASGATLYAAAVTLGWAVEVGAPILSPALMILAAGASIYHARHAV